LATFEAAFLTLLREIDPGEVLHGDQGADTVAALAGELAAVGAELAEAKTYLKTKGFNPIIADHITDLTTRKDDLAQRLAQARQEADHPLAATWEETPTLVAALEQADDPEDARLRLRAALQRIIARVWLLVVPRGRDRLAALQVELAGGRRRDYVILNRPPKNNGRKRVEGGWWCKSLVSVAKPGDLDLGKPSDAAKLAKTLSSIDLKALEGPVN
jgi:hypothetical protein